MKDRGPALATLSAILCAPMALLVLATSTEGALAQGIRALAFGPAAPTAVGALALPLAATLLLPALGLNLAGLREGSSAMLRSLHLSMAVAIGALLAGMAYAALEGTMV